MARAGVGITRRCKPGWRWRTQRGSRWRGFPTGFATSLGGVTVGTVIVIVIGAVLVFGLAALVIGREARRLDAIAPRAVYIDAEAVDYVAATLTPEAQARVTPEELSELLRAHMYWLWKRGLQPTKAVDERQHIDRPVVLDDIGATGYLIGESERLGIAVDDDAIAQIVDGHLAYLDAIGAVGPTAEDPDVDVLAIERGVTLAELEPGEPTERNSGEPSS